MTNLDRPLSGDLMRFDLDDEIRAASGEGGVFLLTLVHPE